MRLSSLDPRCEAPGPFVVLPRGAIGKGRSPQCSDRSSSGARIVRAT
jgi:hypothetical protein